MRVSGRAAIAALFFLAATSPASYALPPPASCTAPHDGSPGCPNLLSDQIVFRRDDPSGYEILAHINTCDFCQPTGPDSVRIVGKVYVDFGPYTTCPAGESRVFFALPGPPAHFIKANGAPEEAEYVPIDPARIFPRDVLMPFTPLRTRCVSLANLPYTLNEVSVGGAAGAITVPGTAFLTLPINVRGIGDAGSLTKTNSLAEFTFRSGLTFSAAETKPAGTPFRFWPDGLPFRLGPNSVTYAHDVVSIGFAPAGGGWDSYAAALPSDADIPFGFGQALPCSDPPGFPCSTPVIHNGSYFGTDSWDPTAASFDNAGMDLDLSLPDTASVTYQSVFPRGVTLALEGPATLHIRDGAIDDGSFDTGRLWLETAEHLDLDDCEAANGVEMSLLTGEVEVGAHGSVLAGIDDINPGGNQIRWSFNTATNLDCGSLVASPAVNDKGPAGTVRGPQTDWLASLVAPVQGRGLYAGVNYNRDRVCVDGGGVPNGQFCRVTTDCAAGTCSTSHLAPHCSALPVGPVPTWTPTLEGTAVDLEILPGDAATADREMAFFARASGVTGVFDGGASATGIGSPPTTFDVDFTSLGLAFLDSSNAGQDSLANGAVNLPWPSSTDLPFAGMSVCDCGRLDSAEVPEEVASRILAYWDTEFRPYGIHFSALALPNCLDPSQTGCSVEVCSGGPNDGVLCDADADCLFPFGTCEAATSRSACISSETTVEHLTPDFLSAFDVRPSGQPGTIRPVGSPRLELDSYQNEHYPYDPTEFVFSDHAADGSKTQAEVEAGSVPYGYLDARGDVSLPLFGLSRGGLKVQKRGGIAGAHQIDAHDPNIVYYDEPPPGSENDSAFEVLREMGAGNLKFRYRVDYFPPELTARLDGSSALGGRGLFLGFSFPAVDDGSLLDGINLGAIEAPAGVVMDTAAMLGDFGSASIVRQWGATVDEGRDRLRNLMSGEVNRFTAGLEEKYQDAVDILGASGFKLDDLGQLDDELGQVPEALTRALHDTLAIDRLADIPDAAAIYNSAVPGAGEIPDLGMNASDVAGYLGVSGDLGSIESIDNAFVDASLDTAGEFFAMARSTLNVQRYVEEGEEVLTDLGREIVPDSMQLPGKQDIGFPEGIPGLQWHFDYDLGAGIPPTFTFKSLTGSLDLTEGGFAGAGFGELGATLSYAASGDWYFKAGLQVDFKQVSVEGDVLLGNTTDLTPLLEIDPEVVDFLGEIERFDGGYIRVGATYAWINAGCPLTISVGAEVGGWYIKSEDSFGGKLGGFIRGEGACLVNVKGEMNLIGGKVDDTFKLAGDFWAGGGIGFDCDPGSWDRPEDVLADDWCLACVQEADCTYTHPGGDVVFNGPDFTCR